MKPWDTRVCETTREYLVHRELREGSQSIMAVQPRKVKDFLDERADDLDPLSSSNKLTFPVFTFSHRQNTLEFMETCFAAFDADGDGCLSFSEFEVLCGALFRNDEDEPYTIEEKKMQEMFSIFDVNQDGLIDVKEFELCWQKWIYKIVRPVSALILVDIQNDFISGSLAMQNCPAKQNGEEVVNPVNRLLDTVEFDEVFYSLDWHPENHISFHDNVTQRKLHESSEIQSADEAQLYDTVTFEGNPPQQQKLWPRHCVQNSWGAKLHEDLKIAEGSSFIYKGTDPNVDSYSAFWDNKKLSATALHSELSSKGVTDCYVCGIAFDICVGATATHANELGYRTALVSDCSRGTSIQDIKATENIIRDGNGIVIHSNEVKSLVQGRDRRPELGYKLALELRKEIQHRLGGN